VPRERSDCPRGRKNPEQFARAQIPEADAAVASLDPTRLSKHQSPTVGSDLQIAMSKPLGEFHGVVALSRGRVPALPGVFLKIWRGEQRPAIRSKSERCRASVRAPKKLSARRIPTGHATTVVRRGEEFPIRGESQMVG